MTAPIKPTITFDEFEKLDIRVGTIVLVEDIEGSDKLIKLTVDLGEETTRTILVGMKRATGSQRRDRRQTGAVCAEFTLQNYDGHRVAGHDL